MVISPRNFILGQGVKKEFIVHSSKVSTSTENLVVSGATTVTMNPIKMEQLDEYLTSQLVCPPANLQDPITNRSIQDPSPPPPAIDLFLNPNR